MRLDCLSGPNTYTNRIRHAVAVQAIRHHPRVWTLRKTVALTVPESNIIIRLRIPDHLPPSMTCDSAAYWLLSNLGLLDPVLTPDLGDQAC